MQPMVSACWHFHSFTAKREVKPVWGVVAGFPVNTFASGKKNINFSDVTGNLKVNIKSFKMSILKLLF